MDIVADFEKAPIPLRDDSVSHVFSSHCVEHLAHPERFFQEIARVAQDGAVVEIWTPYAFSNEAFIFGHLQYLNEEHYVHLCLDFQDFWKQISGAFWKWHSIRYVIKAQVMVDLRRAGVPLDFAIKYYKNVVREFGVNLSVCKSSKPERAAPERRFCLDRNAPSYRFRELRSHSDREVEKALKAYGVK